MSGSYRSVVTSLTIQEPKPDLISINNKTKSGVATEHLFFYYDQQREYLVNRMQEIIAHYKKLGGSRNNSDAEFINNPKEAGITTILQVFDDTKGTLLKIYGAIKDLVAALKTKNPTSELANLLQKQLLDFITKENLMDMYDRDAEICGFLQIINQKRNDKIAELNKETITLTAEKKHLNKTIHNLKHENTLLNESILNLTAASETKAIANSNIFQKRPDGSAKIAPTFDSDRTKLKRYIASERLLIIDALVDKDFVDATPQEKDELIFDLLEAAINDQFRTTKDVLSCLANQALAALLSKKIENFDENSEEKNDVRYKSALEKYQIFGQLYHSGQYIPANKERLTYCQKKYAAIKNQETEVTQGANHHEGIV